ncbi:MAG: hypothetical protein U5K70_05485 [Halodesulfurarchaeum sp.]|nr:hypothetical protein [Halodesulfurarchaeum sp.]
MAPTVDDRRNEIREAVGRHARIESTAFTKEALAAICEAVGEPVEPGRMPSKSTMRARILQAIDPEAEAPSNPFDRAFRKAELDRIAAALNGE